MSTAPSVGRLAGALLDQAREPLRERDAAGLDADERDLAEVRVPLDDLVRDARERPRERVCVEKDFPDASTALTAQGASRERGRA